jgi:MtrB/PioB family decaheme-associated outer membrane protein
MALAPDNEFQQFAVDARYRTEGGIRLEAGAAFGFGTQDAALLPATVNPSFTVGLPRATADAEVATQLLFARAAIPMGAGVALRAEVRYDARDADTPQDYWTQVVTDTYVAPSRLNVAYGHEKMRMKVEGDWMVGGVRFLARAQSLVTDRDQEVVARTDEDSLTFEAHGYLFDEIDWGFEIGADSRDASPYAGVGGAAPQNPLMRVFPYAEMDRDRIAFTVGVTPTHDLSLAVRVERSAEDYDETEIGLTDRDDTGVGLDVSYQVAEDMSLGAFYQRQTLATDQAGSAAYATPDWIGRSEDATEALGITFAAPYLTEKMGLRAELNLTETTGLVTVDQGATDAFPETLSKLRQFVVMADYRYSERVTLRFGVRLEDLASADWALAGVDPDTVSNLLWSGQREPDYELEVFELGVKIGL